MLKKEDIIKIIENKNFKFKSYEHEAFFTVNDSNNKRPAIDGLHTKNLFLKNKKNKFFMLSCEEKCSIDLKKFSKSINSGNLSFAREEYLINMLGIEAGSVSPFALLNDNNNLISFFLDFDLYIGEKINFHPLINTSTITINTKDFINLMTENNKKINVFLTKEYKLLKTI